MKEMKEFKYLGTVLWKHREMEGEKIDLINEYVNNLITLVVVINICFLYDFIVKNISLYSVTNTE